MNTQKTIPFANSHTIAAHGTYSLYGLCATHGLIGVEFLSDAQSEGLPNLTYLEFRCNGGSWERQSTDPIGWSNNYRSIIVDKSGNYDLRLKNDSADSVVIGSGTIIRITHAE